MRATLAMIAVLALAAAPAAFADFLEEGTHGVRVDYVYDDEMGSESSSGIELGFGGAIVPLDDVGIWGGYRDNDDATLRTLGIYLEEHYETGTPFVPFIGVAAGYGWLDLEEDNAFVDGMDDNEESWMFRVQSGLKLVLSENLALSGALLLWWSDDDIFLEGDEVDDTNVEVSLGARFYY